MVCHAVPCDAHQLTVALQPHCQPRAWCTGRAGPPRIQSRVLHVSRTSRNGVCDTTRADSLGARYATTGTESMCTPVEYLEQHGGSGLGDQSREVVEAV